MNITYLPYLPFVPVEDAWEFNEIPQPAKDKARLLHDIAARINAATKNKTAIYQQCADEIGVSFNTVYTPVNAFLKSGNWRHLIDRKIAGSRFWQRTTPSFHPVDFVNHWQDLVLENQRCASAAYIKLMNQLRSWRAGDLNSRIPGFATPPPDAKGCKHPRKWSLRDLMRILPNDIETAAARSGRTAAMKLVPNIRTTRKGGWACMEYQYDDMWHDFEVMHNSQICRLLEFNAVDFYSGFIFNPGLRPRILNENGKHETLTEKQFRLWAIHHLATVGWSPRGTTLQGERGTAAFRALAPRLIHWSGGLLKIPLPGMSGTPAMIGGWKELAKGNPNAKALKEGLGKLIHNRLADLPGQVGMNPENKPAYATGRDQEARDLIALQQCISTPLIHNHLSFVDAAHIIAQRYMEINQRTEHDMEGWIEENLYTQEYCVDPHNGIWIDVGSLPPEKRDALAIIASVHPHHLRPRRLSPAEVIHPALKHNIRLSPEAEADCLYEDCQRDEGVSSGNIEFKDSEMGPGKFRYYAEYQDRMGFNRVLPNDSECKIVVNPFNPIRAFLYDLKGSYLGITKQNHDIQRADVDALHRAQGEKESRYKAAKLAVEYRHGLKRENQLTHNARALIDSLQSTIKPTTPSTSYDLSDEYAAADPQPIQPTTTVDVSILL